MENQNVQDLLKHKNYAYIKSARTCRCTGMDVPKPTARKFAGIVLEPDL